MIRLFTRGGKPASEPVSPPQTAEKPAPAPASSPAPTEPKPKRLVTVDLDSPDEAAVRAVLKVSGPLFGRRGGRKPKAKDKPELPG